MKNHGQSVLRNFKQDCKGTVAMLFGLSLLPIMAGTGVAIDYSRASNSRQAFQSAADAAALAGAKARSISDAEASKVAKQVFDANLKMSGYAGLVIPSVQFFEPGGVRVTGSTQLENTFLPIIGIKTADVSYHAEASTAAASSPGGGGVGDEIALVLDNTGSMSNDMQTLREASVAFVDKAMTGTTKVSVVPFVTAVNVGSSNLQTSHLDTQSKSIWHGIFTRNPTEKQSVLNYNGGRALAVADGGCSYGTGAGPAGPGKGGKGVSLTPGQWDLDDALRLIFGVNQAHAQSATVTPNTIPPLQGATVARGSAAQIPGTMFVPDGFRLSYFGCHLEPPTKINHFDLLARMPGAKWKGCVEARPEPYDVTDDEPSAGVANTLYTPYFWPDEHDPVTSWMPAPLNNYMSDGTLPSGWQHNDRTANLLKYNGSNKANVVEIAPDTLGPNKACPSELLRLSSDKNAVKSSLNNMRHWNGGGTVLVEGLAWGWRTLSPNAPLKDGKPYSKDSKKTIVFMSDGDNELGESGTDYYSHYSSYGFLASGRFPVATFADANKYLDDRFLLACDNAKKKGIKIITILFRNKQGNSVNMMKKCASTPADAYFAGDQIALKKTFDTISGSFASSALKLTK
jgi:Flp pilus assembly protein TadG